MLAAQEGHSNLIFEFMAGSSKKRVDCAGLHELGATVGTAGKGLYYHP